MEEFQLIDTFVIYNTDDGGIHGPIGGGDSIGVYRDWESTIEGMKEQQRGLMRTMINTKDPNLFTKSDRATKLFAEGMDAAVSSDPAMQMTGQQKMEVARQIINNDDIVPPNLTGLYDCPVPLNPLALVIATLSSTTLTL